MKTVPYLKYWRFKVLHSTYGTSSTCRICIENFKRDRYIKHMAYLVYYVLLVAYMYILQSVVLIKFDYLRSS